MRISSRRKRARLYVTRAAMTWRKYYTNHISRHRGQPRTGLVPYGRRDRSWCTDISSSTTSWHCPRQCPQHAAAAAACRGKAHGVQSARGWETVVSADIAVGLTKSAASLATIPAPIFAAKPAAGSHLTPCSHWYFHPAVGPSYLACCSHPQGTEILSALRRSHGTPGHTTVTCFINHLRTGLVSYGRRAHNIRSIAYTAMLLHATRHAFSLLARQ